MTALTLVRQLWRHSFWADESLRRALFARSSAPQEAWREYTHILGAEEVWLSRLQHRQPRVGVWPSLLREEALVLQRSLRAEYEAMLTGLRDERLGEVLAYTTTDGRDFTNSVGDVLVHIAMHGQYHRGKVNLLLRQSEMEPSPVDFISFVRGAAAATTPRL